MDQGPLQQTPEPQSMESQLQTLRTFAIGSFGEQSNIVKKIDAWVQAEEKKSAAQTARRDGTRPTVSLDTLLEKPPGLLLAVGGIAVLALTVLMTMLIVLMAAKS